MKVSWNRYLYESRHIMDFFQVLLDLNIIDYDWWMHEDRVYMEAIERVIDQMEQK